MVVLKFSDLKAFLYSFIRSFVISSIVTVFLLAATQFIGGTYKAVWDLMCATVHGIAEVGGACVEGVSEVGGVFVEGVSEVGGVFVEGVSEVGGVFVEGVSQVADTWKTSMYQAVDWMEGLVDHHEVAEEVKSIIVRSVLASMLSEWGASEENLLIYYLYKRQLTFLEDAKRKVPENDFLIDYLYSRIHYDRRMFADYSEAFDTELLDFLQHTLDRTSMFRAVNHQRFLVAETIIAHELKGGYQKNPEVLDTMQTALLALLEQAQTTSQEDFILFILYKSLFSMDVTQLNLQQIYLDNASTCHHPLYLQTKARLENAYTYRERLSPPTIEAYQLTNDRAYIEKGKLQFEQFEASMCPRHQ